MTKTKIYFALYLALAGCSQILIDGVTELPQSKTTSQTIQLSQGVYLNVDHIWPLTSTSGSFLQRVRTTVAGQENTMTAHITQTPDHLNFVAFNDIIGRLYALNWTQNKTTWDASEHIPETMIPENIIGDFLLVHLDQEKLNKNLVGAHVIDTGDTRILYAKNNTVLRKMTRRHFKNGVWQKVILENPILKYQLDIETVIA
jgi:hypothetical protein